MAALICHVTVNEKKNYNNMSGFSLAEKQNMFSIENFIFVVHITISAKLVDDLV